MTRDEIHTELLKVNCGLQSNVNNSTDVLFVGDKPGAKKVKDASSRGVQVLSQKALIDSIAYTRQLMNI